MSGGAHARVRSFNHHQIELCVSVIMVVPNWLEISEARGRKLQQRLSFCFKKSAAGRLAGAASLNTVPRITQWLIFHEAPDYFSFPQADHNTRVVEAMWPAGCALLTAQWAQGSQLAFVDGKPSCQVLEPAASFTCSTGLWFMAAVRWKLNSSIYILPSSINISTELELNTWGLCSIVQLLTAAKKWICMRCGRALFF